MLTCSRSVAQCKQVARTLLIALLLLIITGLHRGSDVYAQPYCAVYNNGTQNCGIPTLQSCEQSVSGVGGTCQPDNTAQLRPDLFGGGRLLRDIEGATSPPNQGNSPNSPGWMPPPPGQ